MWLWIIGSLGILGGFFLGTFNNWFSDWTRPLVERLAARTIGKVSKGWAHRTETRRRLFDWRVSQLRGDTAAQALESVEILHIRLAGSTTLILGLMFDFGSHGIPPGTAASMMRWLAVVFWLIAILNFSMSSDRRTPLEEAKRLDLDDKLAAIKAMRERSASPQ